VYDLSGRKTEATKLILIEKLRPLLEVAGHTGKRNEDDTRASIKKLKTKKTSQDSGR
jgi:hypothetical protein